MPNILPIDFIDVSSFAASLVSGKSAHFGDDTRRQSYAGSAHHDTRSIALRRPAELEIWFEDVEHIDAGLMKEWPEAEALVDAISSSHIRRMGSLPIFGKILVVGLRPGGWVDWHTDEGPYAEAYDRFHLPIIYSPGAALFSGGEMAYMLPGQLVWFNNRMPHSAINMGPVERVNLIIDIRKPGHAFPEKRTTGGSHQ